LKTKSLKEGKENIKHIRKQKKQKQKRRCNQTKGLNIERVQWVEKGGGGGWMVVAVKMRAEIDYWN